MEIDIIPQTYDDWYQCITAGLKQDLTLPFIDKRINALNSPSEPSTKRFVELYGEQQRLKTVQWFEQAKQSLS